MSLNRKKSWPIPERWLHCPQNGNQLVVAKFMPLKTPLSDDYNISSVFRYPPQELFYRAKQNFVRIGLWIDLTNTNRYYNKKDITLEGCRYFKLNCKGHGQTPSAEQTKLFISLIDDHIHKYPFDCIAVHCTHGFNRTGFLIISYLIERLGFDIFQALEAFAQSRPPGIYKNDYIEELFRRYGKVEDAPSAPDLPEWCGLDKHHKRKRNNCV